MKLNEYLKINKTDEDFFDTQFDICITCCDIDEDDLDLYTTFCTKLYSKVEIKDKCHVHWSSFIKNNYKHFKKFTQLYWYNDYEDIDDFVYEWLGELQQYVAGEVGDQTYIKLIDLIDKCK